jgi:hypothetical protein
LERLWKLACCCCLLSATTSAQQQQDPDDERKTGLWLDQTISASLRPRTSLEFETHQRLDDGATHLYEYFFQGGIGFVLRPWLRLIPSYRYDRYRGSITSYENRVMVNVTMNRTVGRCRPNFRTILEGRLPKNRPASARIRLRPGIDYDLPIRWPRPPVAVVSNEFFLVPGPNSFTAGGHFTQNRFQAGVRFPISDYWTVRPYFMLRSDRYPSGWNTTRILGLSIGFKF